MKMTLKQFMRSLVREYKTHGLKIAYYYARGHIRWWIHRGAIREWYNKTLDCRVCFEKGSCIHCGCSFNELALSGKRCVNEIIEEAKSPVGINPREWIIGTNPWRDEGKAT